jgi:hypothetical protein
MYAKCRSMKDAHRVLNKTPFQDVIPWNAMILGHVKWEQGQKPLILFQQMQWDGMQPDSFTFLGVLNACATVATLEEGRCTHEQIIQYGWDSDVFAQSSLVDMYANCRCMEEAHRVFSKIPSDVHEDLHTCKIFYVWGRYRSSETV